MFYFILDIIVIDKDLNIKNNRNYGLLIFFGSFFFNVNIF